MDSRLWELCHKLDDDIRANFTKMKHVRVLFETKDHHYRNLSERVERENLEGRLKQLQVRIEDLTKGSADHKDTVEILQ